MRQAPTTTSPAPEHAPVRPRELTPPPPVTNPVRHPGAAPERKHGMAGAATLDFECEVKLVSDGGDEKAGRIEGYASVFGVLDRGGDIMQPGAFKRTLADWKRKKQFPPMLWQHDPHTPIGVWTDLVEDERGLKVVGEMIMDVPQAVIARALVKAGAVRGLSIGYLSRDDAIDRATGARLLKHVDLWEISPVTFPMLPEAQIAGVKDVFDAQRWERAFRDEGLSNREAKAAVAAARKLILRDGGQTGDGSRDEKTDLLLSLRRATSVLGD